MKRLSARRGRHTLPNIDIRLHAYETSPTSLSSEHSAGPHTASSWESPVTPSFPQRQHDGSEDWTNDNRGVGEEVHGLGMDLGTQPHSEYIGPTDDDGRYRSPSTPSSDTSDEESDNDHGFYSPPLSPPADADGDADDPFRESYFPASFHKRKSYDLSLYVLDTQAFSSEPSLIAPSNPSPTPPSPDPSRIRSASSTLFRKVLPRLRPLRRHSTQPNKHASENRGTKLPPANTHITSRPTGPAERTKLFPSDPRYRRPTIDLPKTPRAEDIVQDKVFDDIVSAPPPPLVSPLASPQLASVPFFETLSHSTSTASSLHGPGPVESIDDLLQQMDIQDAAFEATEKTMQSSGWSSSEDIKQLRQTRASVRVDWETKITRIKVQ